MPADFASSTPTIAKPKTDYYALIGMLAFIGAGVVGAVIYASLTAPRDDTPLWIVASFSCAFFVVPNLVALWIIARLRLMANARGLRIRSAFRTQFIAWPDVEDYELRAAPQAATSRETWIRVGEKWQRLPSVLANMEALRARIQTEATSSRARQWQLNVARDDTDDWPKTYAYRDPSGRRSFWLAFAGLLFYFGFAFRGAFSAQGTGTVRLVWDSFEGWEHLAFLVPPLLVLAMFALWLLPMVAAMRAKKRLGAQTIRADQTALTRLDGDAQTRISWGEITDYFIEDAKGLVITHQRVVEGADARIVFRHEITGFGELKTLIQTRAVNAKSTQWLPHESADSDTFGGEPSLWAQDVAGVGRKIYHYRTRTVRAMLLLGGFVMLILPIHILGLVPLRDGQMPTLPDRMIGLVFVAPIVALMLGGALAFWRASIQTDENGLTQINVWGERFLRWDEIESFVFYNYFYQVKGARTTIRYGAVAASESLRAEIETRTGRKMNRTDRVERDE